ncbi:hypothetical protein, conserved in T. vivax [Trypanosoma vivax Y486]|uniref:Uncharacterized protein n=1 Tax=Trypanosoma vivax (strain Y486) TaxID=1055687 RepID=F9WKN4_TRYVY|nr:hypothetical protein, conserved in T. vivax [Trypanosoma vivax Y486]|eukprot:CCD18056.1 hypothetical protein, conserved in T. vivax [Trypanosoma vivax Y486]
MQVKCALRSALLLGLVLCSFVDATRPHNALDHRMKYNGHAYVYDVHHGKQLDIACNISHYVSTLMQFHKERKGNCSGLEGVLREAEADAKKKADGLADEEDRKAIQVKHNKAVEESGEARKLLTGTIYLLAVEENDLHYARKCARDFIKDDKKCFKMNASLDVLAAKNGVKEGMQKYEEMVESNYSCMTVFKRVIPSVEAAEKEVLLTVKAVQGAVASFDETGREAERLRELRRIQREKAVVACEVEKQFSIVRQFFIALKSIAVDGLAVARELKERAEVTSGLAAAYGVAGNITLDDVEEMYSAASRVAVNATDALSRCYPLPRTFAQLRPEVQGARLCEQDVANERTVLVHTTVENIKSTFPNMSEWARVSMDLWGKSVKTPKIVPKCETWNTTVDYCNSLVKEFESSVNHSDSERKHLEAELGSVFELIAVAEKMLEEAEEVVEKERQTRAEEERVRIDKEEAERMKAYLEEEAKRAAEKRQQMREAKEEAVQAASEERAPTEAGRSRAEYTELVVSDLLGEEDDEDENKIQVDVAPGNVSNVGKKWNSKTMLVATVVPVVVVLGAGSAWFVRQRAHTTKKVASL